MLSKRSFLCVQVNTTKTVRIVVIQGHGCNSAQHVEPKEFLVEREIGKVPSENQSIFPSVIGEDDGADRRQVLSFFLALQDRVTVACGLF